MSFTPSLEEVISQAIEDHLLDVHTSIPAIIESYDAAKQRASVKIALKRKYIEGDEEVLTERPIIPDVPVLFPKGSNFSLTFPLKKGDDVHLIFSERSTEKWRNESGVVDPKDARKFSLSDAFILPASGRTAIAGASATKTILKNDSASVELSDGGDLLVKNSVGSIEITPQGLVELKNSVGSIEITPQGLVELKNSAGSIRMTAAGKFKIQGSKELLDIIDRFIDAMNAAQVLTAFGLQPFWPPTPTTLTQLKNDLAAIKE